MAFLLLASTTTWKVEKHFCMGHLVDLAFFTDAEDCGMSMQSMNDATTQQLEDSCCSEEVILIDGQDDLKIAFDNLSVDQQFFLIAFAYSKTTLFNVSAQKRAANEYYPPPILVRDIQLLDQVFLI
ncbi:MAG: hypothetical protein HKP42_13400 [Maribacter sp.]|nr:hypothetical protein [Maribacter sp.]NNK77045.1 hypothetical protein [Maribacter sp.]